MKCVKCFLIIILSLLYIISVGSCKASKGHSHGDGAVHAHDGEDDHEHEHENIAVTKWSSQLEVFMEYPPPVRGESLDFIIHLTKLSDFKAVKSGTIELLFTPKNGSTFTVKKNELLREGIFKPTVFFSKTGTYGFKIRFNGEKISDTVDIGSIQVVEDPHDVEVSEDAGQVEEISFLKEQQWKIDFTVQPAKTMIIKSSVQAVAEVLPASGGHFRVTAPVAGLLGTMANNPFPLRGMSVKRGQLMVQLFPALGGGNSWTALQLKFKQSRDEYERAKVLLKKGAISQREFAGIERRYLMLSAGFPKRKGQGSSFSIPAPGDGIISQVSVLPGQRVESGDLLMTVIDIMQVTLKVNLYETDYHQLSQPSGAALRIPGSDEPLFLSSEQMQPLGQGDLLDPKTHTIPLLFNLDNTGKRFKIGQVIQTELYTDKERSAVCVPHQAVYDDDGRPVVFVQLQGETFEKRHITTGTAYLGWLEVTNGIEAGERVVTRGAYLVKLAGTSAPIGHGHTH